MAAGPATIVETLRELEASTEGSSHKAIERDEPGHLRGDDPVGANRDLRISKIDKLHKEDPWWEKERTLYHI